MIADSRNDYPLLKSIDINGEKSLASLKPTRCAIISISYHIRAACVNKTHGEGEREKIDKGEREKEVCDGVAQKIGRLDGY